MSSMARSPPEGNKLGQLSTTCSNATEAAQWGTPNAVDHNQLRPMASETVDPIDYSHPPP